MHGMALAECRFYLRSISIRTGVGRTYSAARCSGLSTGRGSLIPRRRRLPNPPRVKEPLYSNLKEIVRKNDWENAMREVDLAVSNGTDRCAVHGYSTVVREMGKAGDWKKVLRVLEHVTGRGTRPDFFFFIQLLHAIGRNGRWEEALGLLASMYPKYGVKPCTVCCNLVMRSLADARQFDAALQLVSILSSRLSRLSSLTGKLVT